jgi:O-antigen ligase
MTAVADNGMTAVLARRWRDPAAWTTTVDVCAILLAASLPWSTSLVGVFATAMLLTRIPFLDLPSLWRLARQPICAVPIALFALAAIGMLWSDADWAARTYAVKPAAKLLVLPILFYHFQRSERGLWVLIAFLVSCVLLEAASWLIVFKPSLTMKPHGFETRGIVVKDYIDQSQEFALCAVALAYPIIQLLRAKKIWQAALLGAIALSFVANMAFVIVSRTALVTMPITVAVFGLVHLRWRTNLMILAGVAVVGVAATGIDGCNLLEGISGVQGNGSFDVDRAAAGILAEVASIRCRGAGVRPWHRRDPRPVREGSGGTDWRSRRGHRQSAQPDLERRGAVGRARRCRALRDVAMSSAAVPRRGTG